MSVRVEPPMKITVMRVVASAVVLGLFFASSKVKAAELAAAPRSKVLMIMCDQLNAFTMGVAGCDVRTPKIDRLG
jgi:hypothetical protein